MHKCEVKPGPKQEFYSIDAAAAYLTIGATTIYKAVQQRQVKHARIGKSIRISHENLIRWIEGQSKDTLAEINAKNSTFCKRRDMKAHPSKRPVNGSIIWPPKTIRTIRKLARLIELKMLKGEIVGTRVSRESGKGL
jgi:excisionase family DNA binding protein